jgi:hypothetical protein
MPREGERRDITRKQYLTVGKIEALGLQAALFWICKLQFSDVPTADSVEQDALSY